MCTWCSVVTISFLLSLEIKSKYVAYMLIRDQKARGSLRHIWRVCKVKALITVERFKSERARIAERTRIAKTAK